LFFSLVPRYGASGCKMVAEPPCGAQPLPWHCEVWRVAGFRTAARLYSYAP